MENITPVRHKNGEITFRVQLRYRGEKHSKNFDNVSEARTWRNGMKTKREQGVELDATDRASPDMPLVRFVEDIWWPQHVRQKLAAKTDNNYNSAFVHWILPCKQLIAKPIAAIDSQDIIEWYSWAEKRGGSPDSIRQATKVLSGAFTWAAQRPRDTGVRGNPVSLTRWPKAEREHEPVIASRSSSSACVSTSSAATSGSTESATRCCSR